MRIDNTFEKRSELWLKKTFFSLYSHFNPKGKNFFRNSNDVSLEEKYPTATLHCYNTKENFEQIEDYHLEKFLQFEKMYSGFEEYFTKNSFDSLLKASSNSIDPLRKYVFIERYIYFMYKYIWGSLF